MQRHARVRLGALFLPLVLALGLVACDGEEAEQEEQAQQSPREAVRDAVEALGEYDGFEMVIGVELDEAAQQAMLAESEMGEQELELLTGSTLTVRAAEGDDEEQGESEFVLVVGDEQVLSVRALAESELYALIDLPAIEQVAQDAGAGDGFQQGLDEFEQMSGMFGLGEVVSAARDGEWIRVAGLDQMMETFEEEMPEEEEIDEAELEEVAREVGQRLEEFLDDPEVGVEHVDSEDAGERIRISAEGPQLRTLVADVFSTLEGVMDFSDPTGMGMDPDQLQNELEQSIPDDLEISFDVWLEGGELSQVAVDVFGIARDAGAEDAPDGEFLVAIGMAEFSESIEAPETDVTFDVFEMFGGMLGGLGDMGGDPSAGEDLDLGDLPDETGGPDAQDCVPAEVVEQFGDLDDDEVEEMLGAPPC